MTFSQYAGVAIVPTLSRIVLCVAFVSAGYNKVFKQTDFTLEEAARLKTLDIEVMAQQMALGDPSSGWIVRPAAYIQEEPPTTTQPETAEPPAAPAPETASHQDPPPAQPPVAEPEATKPIEPPVVTPAPETYRAAGMYKIAVMLDKAGWPQPKMMTWLAAYTELLGGVLLGLGLFSRVWGLGLSVAMGVAFYMVSVSLIGMPPGHPAVLSTHPFTFAENPMAFTTTYCQLGLGLLAFGVFLTGPGPLSLDRLLFGRHRDEVQEVTIT